MFDMLLSAWMMQETANAAWAFNPAREVIASAKSAWVTSNPPYQARLQSAETKTLKDAAHRERVRPTRANLLVANGLNDTTAQRKITPKMVHYYNRSNKDFCVSGEHPNYQEGRNTIDARFDPVREVARFLDGVYDIAPQNNAKLKIVQKPKHGRLIAATLEESMTAHFRLNTRYNLTTTTFTYVPDNSFKYDPVKNNNLLGEDHVKFEVTLNNKKFISSYVIKVVTSEGRECDGDYFANVSQ